MPAARCIANVTCIYQGDESDGFIRIERLPDSHIVPLPARSVTIHTASGKKELVRIQSGDCKSIIYVLLLRSGSGEAPRLAVETKDKSNYSILMDHKVAPTMKSVDIVMEKLALERVYERRHMLAHVIRRNDEKQVGIERLEGHAKWPEARKQMVKVNAIGLPELAYGRLTPWEIKEFPKGGVIFGMSKNDDDTSIANDSKLYFDGVSFGELAQYLEEMRRSPVVNQTNDTRLYSFTLPWNIWKQFDFDKAVPLPGLGLSVKSEEIDLDAVVVRDKRVEGTVRQRPKGQKTRPQR